MARRARYDEPTKTVSVVVPLSVDRSIRQAARGDSYSGELVRRLREWEVLEEQARASGIDVESLI